MNRFASLLIALAFAAPAAAAPLTFTTLGTNSGPIPRGDRSEPANLVRRGDQLILVDVGDGAAEQLAKAGLSIDSIPTILISHVHFDHTAGLFGFLSLRFQTSGTSPLTIYGPPGTQETVTRLFAAMQPGAAAIQTMRLEGGPDAGVRVVELRDGQQLDLGEIRVTAAENTHYATLPADRRPISLSYRFDAPGRAILYTGDTGPSPRVEQLCKGVDLLVSEIMNPALAIAHIKATRPGGPPAIYKVVEDHFRREHLSPEEVGKLAAACGAKTLAATHNALERNQLRGARAQIASHFKGRIVFAEDLQTF